jgi:hypothetical protein
MGREVKRVPIGFNWPMGEIWWGYKLPPLLCQTCDGTGKVPTVVTGFQRDDGTWNTYEHDYCPTCGGERAAFPKVEIPTGPGYQLWEDVSEGSPMSPVFAAPEELAHWLADNKASAFAAMTLNYEKWLAFIKSEKSACCAIFDGKDFISGVEIIADDELKK